MDICFCALSALYCTILDSGQDWTAKLIGVEVFTRFVHSDQSRTVLSVAIS